jgi:hypothetical protein
MALTKPAGVAVQLLGAIVLFSGLFVALPVIVNNASSGFVGLGLVLVVGGVTLLAWGRQPATRK